jgi:hypothetical protein
MTYTPNASRRASVSRSRLLAGSPTRSAR